ncbi:MAG: hypothetical protein M1546_12200 [Chloroflexi bacterium]|nr:hypothetical protein [Chloroflexota bacterium]
MKKKRRAVHRCECKECQRHPYGVLAKEHRAINRVLAGLDEKSRRQCAGVLALQRGRGGVQAVHEISGLSRTTIRRGEREIRGLKRTDRIRAPGGGRQPVEKNNRTS